MQLLKKILFLFYVIINSSNQYHSQNNTNKDSKQVIEKEVKNFIFWGDGKFIMNQNQHKAVNLFTDWLKQNKELKLQNGMFIFMLDGKIPFIWSGTLDMQTNTIGKPSKYFFYIKYENSGSNIKKKIKVFIPSVNDQGHRIKIKKICWDNFKNQGYIDYKIQNKTKKLYQTRIVSDQIKELNRIPNDSINHSVTMEFPKQLYSQTYNLKGFFKKKIISSAPMNTPDKVSNDDKDGAVTIQYNLKNGNKMIALWDKTKRSIISCEIFKNNQLIYKNNADNNKFFNLNEYPTEFALDPHKSFLKILNSLANTISNNIEVIITQPFFIKNDYTMPRLEKYMNKLKLNKPYILIIVPIKLITFQDGVCENRFHIFPFALLMEKFNNLWVLKKMVSTNTCLNQFTFLNYQLHNIVIRFLNHNPQKIIQKINNNKNIDNSIIDNLGYYTDGNHILRLTDFLQLRQSGSNSCYISWAKDSLIIVDYLKDIIDDRITNQSQKNSINSINIRDNKHFLSKNTLSCKDFLTYGSFSIQYNQWKEEKFNGLMENFFLNHKTNVNLLEIHDKFIGTIEITGPQDNGPLKGQDNLVYFKSRLPHLRKKYYMFFITIGNKVISYCVYRSQENKLDNQRYWNCLKKVCNKYYPDLTVAPLIHVSWENFNGESQDENLVVLYKLLQLSIYLPGIYNELKDLSLAFEGEISQDEYVYNTFILYNMEKSIVADYAGDIYMAMIYHISNNFLTNKEIKTNENVKEVFQKEYEKHKNEAKQWDNQDKESLSKAKIINEENNNNKGDLIPINPKSNYENTKKDSISNLADHDLQDVLKVLTGE